MGIAIRDLSLAQAQPLQELFRSAMRGLAGGVSVITVGTDEERTGLTATSVSSLSVEPPSLIVSVNRNSSSWSTLKRHGSFAVNILQARHAAIAERFSGRGGLKGAARYAGASWITLATGAPILEDAVAAFDCEVEEMIERHSHAIVIGKVVAVRLAEEAEPLIYWRGGYLPINAA
ncbi:NADH-FMN oxidoreductase RutF, flavin reductase (DIM6/NTAB) family [Rhizobiales bacterium GAS113]|nr:NADH-FMN oxidoreductase RutF, flavin reductase (DIM6/NTAB) family [Rhizobiales bacterium GAS113]